MAKPQVKTKKKTSAPADVRTAPRNGSLSSRSARALLTARRSSYSLLNGGLPNIDFSNLNLVGLPAGFTLVESYSSGAGQTAPSVFNPTGQQLVVRSSATVSSSSTERVVYSFPVAPNEVNTGRIGISYTELNRPGRKPVLKSAAKPLQQVSATVIVVDSNRLYTASAQPQIKALESLAEIDYDLEIFYPGVDPSKKWRITDLSFRTVRRNTDNSVAIAEASITFTEVQVLPAPVPGMPRLKDVPRSRKSGTNPGATSDDQRDGSLDADIAAIIAAGPKPLNPGTSGSGS